MHFSRFSKAAKLEDFVYRKVLGKGAFGKVLLVENKNTGKLYAMKVIRKDVVIELGILDCLLNERDILYSVTHPFLVDMEYVF